MLVRYWSARISTPAYKVLPKHGYTQKCKQYYLQLLLLLITTIYPLKKKLLAPELDNVNIRS